MSQVNKESPDDPAREQSNSSKTSTGSNCSTTSATSVSSGSTDSLCSGGDNPEGDNSHRHRQCQKSKSHFDSPNGDDLTGASQGGVIERLRSTAGENCDTRTTTSCPSMTNSEVKTAKTAENRNFASFTGSPPLLKTPSPQLHRVTDLDQRLGVIVAEPCDSNQDRQRQSNKCNLSANTTSLGSSYSNISSTIPTLETSSISHTQPSRRILKPAPSPSPSLSTIDTNNNKNVNNSNSLSGLSGKRINFSKSASGSRLVAKGRPNVCDCLTQDCGEKKHSNRRQFIEHYYNSRTQLPSTNTSSSSFNISTPLNRLSECDAITRRLLSSPIRTTNLVESPTRRAQFSDVDKSRRASLGTNTITDQVFIFSSKAFDSLDSSSTSKKNRDNANSNDNQGKCDLDSACSSGENDIKLKHQQGRSLSVCNEETLNPRTRNTSSNHSSNLNRAISLACESGSSITARRLLNIIPLFGCDMSSLEQFTRLGLILPPVIDSAVDHILVNGINSIGIFRKSGVKSRILTLRQRIETNQSLKFDELNQNNEFSIYDIADLVKMWFRELKPAPIMTKELIKLITAFLKTPNTSTNTQQSSILRRGYSSHQESSTTSMSRISLAPKSLDPVLKSRIDSIITPTHRALLLRALNFLAQISAKCEANQMTSQNLAICLTPSLCETESDKNSILLDQKALEFCIDNHRMLFGQSNIE